MLEDVRRKALEKKWREIIRDFQESSLAIGAYARDRHIPKSTLYKWSKQLGLPLKKPSLSFIELPLTQNPPPPPLDVLFPVEVKLSKGGGIKRTLPWPQMIDLVKALL